MDDTNPSNNMNSIPKYVSAEVLIKKSVYRQKHYLSISAIRNFGINTINDSCSPNPLQNLANI